MLKKTYSFATVAISALVGSCCALPTAQAATSTNAADRAYIAKWLVQRQFKTAGLASYGAIVMTSDPAVYAADSKGTPYYIVVPYRSNLAVQGILRTNEAQGLPTARLWNTWVFNHLNSKSAPLGIPYDHLYTADGKNERTSISGQNNISINSHVDATDSAIATFLSTLWATYKKGAPKTDFTARKAQIDALTDNLFGLRQSDGLYWAGRDRAADGTYKHVKYLEDQCEVFAGLRDVALLYAQVLNDATRAKKYGDAATQLQGKIVSEFYSRDVSRLYSWAKHEDGTYEEPDLNEWYASTQAQMWPHLFGVVPPRDSKTINILQRVNVVWDGSPQPQWWTKLGSPAIDQAFPNASFAYAYYITGDTTKTNLYLKYIKGYKYPDITLDPPQMKMPFNVDDAGWLLSILGSITSSDASPKDSTHTN